jgi:hypothetical protein
VARAAKRVVSGVVDRCSTTADTAAEGEEPRDCEAFVGGATQI